MPRAFSPQDDPEPVVWLLDSLKMMTKSRRPKRRETAAKLERLLLGVLAQLGNPLGRISTLPAVDFQPIRDPRNGRCAGCIRQSRRLRCKGRRGVVVLGAP